ncbi:MAG: arsenic transporter [Lachnospiraceae bacterium]|nr:arsenic transporter [Lachnospiraceae bacterium]
MITALIIFVLMYIGMLAFSKFRVFFALGAAACMVIFGVISIGDVPGAINWNVIMMISGTMGIVTLFIETGMPARLADLMLQKVPNACMAIVALSTFSGIVSAFVDNVATVLMVAPVGLAICKKLKINPIPAIIAIAVSSNLQGASTLVGDTTSILLGGYAGMSFIDFIWWQGKPSIFWAVELGALGTIFILLFLFRKQKEPVTSDRLTPVDDHVPGIIMLSVVICLIIASFFEIPYVDDIKNGLICIILFVIDIVRSCIKKKSTEPVKLVSKEMDYSTLGMLCGLFIVIAAINEAGIIDVIADWFASMGNGNTFLLYTIIVFGSVLLSAFIDNIPYVAAMLPVVQGIAVKLGISPEVLYFGLLTGATLGGNITPFGASANVTGIGILRKEGLSVKNSDFFKIGIPFTLTAVTIGYLFIWFVWA